MLLGVNPLVPRQGAWERAAKIVSVYVSYLGSSRGKTKNHHSVENHQPAAAAAAAAVYKSLLTTRRGKVGYILGLRSGKYATPKQI